MFTKHAASKDIEVTDFEGASERLSSGGENYNVVSIGNPGQDLPEGFDEENPEHGRWEFHNVRSKEGEPSELQKKFFRPPQKEDIEEIFEHTSRSNKPTLVHCQAGKHRAPAVGAAVRCAQGESPRTAMKEVKKQRPHADPNKLILRHADNILGGNLEKEAQDVNVLPHVYWPAYEGGDPEEAQTYEYDEKSTRSPDTWEEEYEHDEHFTGYNVPDMEGNVRLKKDTLQDLKEKGHNPQFQWLAADIDNPEHRESTPEDIEKLKKRKQEDDLLGRAGVYSTPRGYRAVWPLQEPVDVEEGESLMGDLHEKLEQKGINVDKSNKDWTRMYRMPKVNRGFPEEEGERLDPEIVDFENIEPIQPDELKKESSMLTKLAAHELQKESQPNQGQSPGQSSSGQSSQGRLTRREFMMALEVIQNLPDPIVRRILKQTKGRERRAVKKLLQFQEGGNVID